MSLSDPHATSTEPSPSPDEVFADAAVVQLIGGNPAGSDAVIARLSTASLVLSGRLLSARAGDGEWAWVLDELERVHHGGLEPWTVLVVPGVSDHGVAVLPRDVRRFRSALAARVDAATTMVQVPADATATLEAPALPSLAGRAAVPAAAAGDLHLLDGDAMTPPAAAVVDPPLPASSEQPVGSSARRGTRRRLVTPSAQDAAPMSSAAGLDAVGISAWFGAHQVLDRVSLSMPAGQVMALIGPSGCGKSTFLRILNRMHELIPGAALAGEVLLAGDDIYDVGRKLTDARRQIGMVFQKPNPFPAMSIYDNVVAGLKLTGAKASSDVKDELVESCLSKAGLWNEVRDRLRQPGGGLSGGQQQRLCIARALAVRPRVLLMDEPCSALDPTSTRRIEQTIGELAEDVTIVIVTHNMQQALRVSDQCAFFLAEQGTPGVIVEHGPTDAMFESPQDQRTSDYVNGRFG